MAAGVLATTDANVQMQAPTGPDKRVFQDICVSPLDIVRRSRRFQLTQFIKVHHVQSRVAPRHWLPCSCIQPLTPAFYATSPLGHDLNATTL